MYQGDFISEAIAWKTALAARTESATSLRTKTALSGRIVRFSSRWSMDPAAAMAAATGGMKTNAAASRIGKLRLSCADAGPWTGIRSIAATATAHRMSLQSENWSGFATAAATRT